MKKLLSCLVGPLLLLSGILIPLVVLELALRSGYRIDDLNWTPPDATIADEMLTTQHLEVSGRHPHGFNDTTISMEKPAGVFRLAILGDSVVWGDGVTDQQRWTRKFEKLAGQKYQNIQVLHWGIRGWSTADQVNFLKENAARWDLDYLIIAYISNDPDVKRITQNHVSWNSYWFPRAMANVFPYASRFIFGYLSQLVNERIPGWGYDYWERELYSADNLKVYAKVVSRLRKVTSHLNIPTSIVLIPSSWYPYFGEQFAKVTPLFKRNGFSLFNMVPEVNQRTSHIPLPLLRANRADGHPGDKMTDAYAEILLAHLPEMYKEASKKELPVHP